MTFADQLDPLRDESTYAQWQMASPSDFIS